MNYEDQSLTQDVLGMNKSKPSFALSDLWSAPLHDFPIRDEIIYQYLELSPDASVLELGPGSGYTAFRLSRQVRDLTLVDIPENIERLRNAFGDRPNITLYGADVCRPGLGRIIPQRFRVAFAMEVFELLPDPAMCLENLADVLVPGGRLLLQFPNYEDPRGPGITHFRTMEELSHILGQAGFEHWSVYSLKLRPYAQFVYDKFHEKPIRLYRRLRTDNGHERPLTYDQSWTFKNQGRIQPYKIFIHSIWMTIFGVLRLGGDCFARTRLTEDILNRNLLLHATR